jgi:hypothetical protein
MLLYVALYEIISKPFHVPFCRDYSVQFSRNKRNLYETLIRIVITSVFYLFFRSVRRLLVTASVVPTSPILVTLMKEALSSRIVGSYKSHPA